MKFIDLTQPLFDSMPVYPGDPEVSIKQFLSLEKDGWNMNVLSFPSHIGTHINVPYHALAKGKTLDDYPVEAFLGPSVVYQYPTSIRRGIGLLFENPPFDKVVVDKITDTRPRFIATQRYFETESELAAEKTILGKGILTFEGLVNVEMLPKDKEFLFYGLPLKIKAGDGSPVRAFAVVE